MHLSGELDKETILRQTFAHETLLALAVSAAAIVTLAHHLRKKSTARVSFSQRSDRDTSALRRRTKVSESASA